MVGHWRLVSPDIIQNPNVSGQLELARIIAGNATLVSAIGVYLGECDRLYEAHVNIVSRGDDPANVVKLLEMPLHLKLRDAVKKVMLALLEHKNAYQPPALDEVTKIFIAKDG